MSVTTSVGFAATGIAARIKGGDHPDLAVVSNLGPRFAVAGVFTHNRVFVAPVGQSRQAVADGRPCAVVLNSSGVNAYTDQSGFADARAMAEKTVVGLDVAAGDVVVYSTGLIDVRLPIPEVTSDIEQAHAWLSPDGEDDAVTAIMTTGTVGKQTIHRGEDWSTGSMAKGAGMLALGLATMLVILTTDAGLEAPVLGAAPHEASRVSFERVDADGRMSINDTVLLLASGTSDITPEAQKFTIALSKLCRDLACQPITDAKGVGHEIAIEVVGVASVRGTETVGREVARSNLFKRVVSGCDPNWGCVSSAIGVIGAAFEVNQLDASFNEVQVCRSGGISEPYESVDLSGRKVHTLIDSYAGEAAATTLTTDLTYEYVKENTECSS